LTQDTQHVLLQSENVFELRGETIRFLTSSLRCNACTVCIVHNIYAIMNLTWNLFVLYNNETKYYRQSFFISKSFNITRKLAFAHFGKHEKSHLT